MKRAIFFTDLDGTLLDHETYQWTGAKPALEALKLARVPLILASSKTAAEIAPLRTEIGFEHCPAIVENGAGLLPAGLMADETGTASYNAIHAALAALPADLRAHFAGFADMGTQGIAEATGLPPSQAALAGTRAFSEPGLWSGTHDEQAQFEAALAQHGITARSGGRFLTLSHGKTKAGLMDDVKAFLFGADASDVLTVALGDAPNDTEMLMAADTAFIVHNPHAKPIRFPEGFDESHVTRLSTKAPAGWNQAVLSILSDLNA